MKIKRSKGMSGLSLAATKFVKTRNKLGGTWAAKCAFRFCALIAFSLFVLWDVPAARATDFVNNFNNQAVSKGYNAPFGTPFTLNQTAQITQLITYHWNDGHGTQPGPNGVGVLTIWTANRLLKFAAWAQGVPGQGGVIANWVVNINPPLTLPAGLYILDDSSHDTWSNNSGTAGCLSFQPSFQCGFTLVRGNYLQPPPPPPPPGPGPGVGFPQKCDHNAGAVAFIFDPCLGKPRAGATITFETERALPSGFTSVAFILSQCPFCGIPPSVGLSFTVPAAGGTAKGSMYTVAVPAALCGGPTAGNKFNGSVWAVVPKVGITGYGVIGRYMADCR